MTIASTLVTTASIFMTTASTLVTTAYVLVAIASIFITNDLRNRAKDVPVERLYSMGDLRSHHISQPNLQLAHQEFA